MRKFGIELEFSESLKYLVDMTKPFFKRRKREVDCSRNLKSDGSMWQFKVDGTTMSEISTPATEMGSREMDRLFKMLNLFKERNVKTTRKDSVHVHVSSEGLDKRKLLIAWVCWEIPILTLFPAHRRKNSYCDRYVKKHRPAQLVAHYYRQSLLDAGVHNQVMNWCEANDRKTIEFRPMEGTVEFTDVQGWLEFIYRFVEYSQGVDEVEMMAGSIKKKNDNFEFVKDVKLEEWVDKRRGRFKSHS